MFQGQCAFAQTPLNPAQEITQLAQQAEADLHNPKTTLAAGEYVKILALDPNNIHAHANLGLAYYLQGKLAEAGPEFEAALRLQPDLWETAALCGLSENQTGQPATAKLHLQQAFEHVTEPKLRMAVGRQLFSILFEAGDLQLASDVVSDLEQLDPANVDVIYAEHQVYSLLANRAFLSMARLAPDSARMYQLRGDEMMQSGKLAGAIAAYRQAVQRDPHLAGAHFALGEALSASQSAADRAEAEGEYKKALADNARDEKAECRLGAIDLDRADLDGAAQHLKRALQLQPDDAEANEGLGMVLMASQSNQDAILYLKRAVQLDPTDGAAHYRLALAGRSLGDVEAANREMEEFRKLRTQKENLKQNFHELPAQTLSPGDQPQREPGP
jgi:tetratricopeptide (TPR) repeat protein